VSKIISVHQQRIAAGEIALFLNKAPVVSRITAIISDKSEPEYTTPLEKVQLFGTFG
jgi:hypothetical protein